MRMSDRNRAFMAIYELKRAGRQLLWMAGYLRESHMNAMAALNQKMGERALARATELEMSWQPPQRFLKLLIQQAATELLDDYLSAAGPRSEAR